MTREHPFLYARSTPDYVEDVPTDLIPVRRRQRNLLCAGLAVTLILAFSIDPLNAWSGNHPDCIQTEGRC